MTRDVVICRYLSGDVRRRPKLSGEPLAEARGVTVPDTPNPQQWRGFRARAHVLWASSAQELSGVCFFVTTELQSPAFVHAAKACGVQLPTGTP
jgi:hypothetical protein